MDRRAFLASPLLLAPVATPRPADGRVMTVRGPVDPAELGPTLPHEHVLVDFIGADAVDPSRYDRGEVERVAGPHLDRLKALGGRALVECTPAYLGRDPALTRSLSEKSGLHILTNTGLYDANGGRHVPAWARESDAEALARHFVKEWEEGLDGTSVRPGFIKLGVDAGPLGDFARTLIRAGAIAHRATGLTLAVHTGDGRAALDQLDLLEREGVDPSAWIWVHAQNERDPALHLEAARRGAWVEFDGVGPDSIERHVELVLALRDAGRLDRVLISHDAGWYHVGEPGGGTFRPFDTLFTAFLPALERAGLGDGERSRLIVDNPARAFVVRRVG